MFFPPGPSLVHTSDRDLLNFPLCREWDIHCIRSYRSISILCYSGRAAWDSLSDNGSEVRKVESPRTLYRLHIGSHESIGTFRCSLLSAADSSVGSALVEGVPSST